MVDDEELDVNIANFSSNYTYWGRWGNGDLFEITYNNGYDTLYIDNFPEVDGNTSIEETSKLFTDGACAVVVNYDGDKKHIITYQDVIRAIA